MKLTKFSLLVISITVLSLLYVHQQVELIKLSYAIASSEKQVLHLLDQRDRLVYNLNNLEAPLRLEKSLFAKETAFEFPARWQLIEIAEAPKETSRDFMKLANFPKRSLLENITQLFSLRAEAQAQEK